MHLTLGLKACGADLKYQLVAQLHIFHMLSSKSAFTRGPVHATGKNTLTASSIWEARK